MTIKRPHDDLLGMPSAEAIRMAAEMVRRRYVLTDTMQHPQVRSECVTLAYLIQAFGLVVTSVPDKTSAVPR